MNEVRSFVLNKVLAFQIFNISEEIPVFLMQKDELIFEIFVTQKQYENGYRHICISIKNREEFIKCMGKIKEENDRCITEYCEGLGETITKQDLSTEWLDENCLCFTYCDLDGDNCGGLFKSEGNCNKYKCGDYTITTWNQLK